MLLHNVQQFCSSVSPYPLTLHRGGYVDQPRQAYSRGVAMPFLTFVSFVVKWVITLLLAPYSQMSKPTSYNGRIGRFSNHNSSFILSIPKAVNHQTVPL